MQRDIKFRGKRKDNGEWIYGSLVVLDYHDSNDYVEAHQIVLLNGHSCDVDPETVGEFTGLYDKNDVGIYEGDIVLCADSGECFPEEYNKEKDEYFPVGKYEVAYQGEVNYPAFELKDSPCEDMNGLAYALANSIEVIGNIYENGDLLQ